MNREFTLIMRTFVVYKVGAPAQGPASPKSPLSCATAASFERVLSYKLCSPLHPAGFA